MEGNKTIESSYNAVKKALKDNTTGRVVIDYKDYDEHTAAILRSAIRTALEKRRKELWDVIQSEVH